VLLATYYDLLNLTRLALQIPPSETWVLDPVPHNVVLVPGWMMVIPRTRAAVGGISANAAAMMGLVCVKSESEVEEWRERGPAGVLGGVGIHTGCDRWVSRG
jgi:ATP adenylyltransferase/5',5'''-P-1,P-4-tetraphosphate phosphorylase II